MAVNIPVLLAESSPNMFPSTIIEEDTNILARKGLQFGLSSFSAFSLTKTSVTVKTVDQAKQTIVD